MRGLDITSREEEGGGEGRSGGVGGEGRPADCNFKIKIIQLAIVIDRRAVKRCADR